MLRRTSPIRLLQGNLSLRKYIHSKEKSVRYAPVHMGSEKERTVLFHSPDGSMIELTVEELMPYTECVGSKKFINGLITVTGGIAASVVFPVKATPPLNYFLKKGLAGAIAMTCLSVFTGLGSALTCAPILQKIIKSKMDNSPESSAPVSEKDEPSTKELLDFTPSISSQDFSAPINFSSDASDADRLLDRLEDSKELGGKAALGKKHVTYDELWRLHKENLQARNKAGDSNEETDLGRTTENKPSWEKKKIRTNKYGDPLE